MICGIIVRRNFQFVVREGGDLISDILDISSEE
jgi:hypothetical protein